jgi:hypothetical protein
MELISVACSPVIEEGLLFYYVRASGRYVLSTGMQDVLFAIA